MTLTNILAAVLISPVCALMAQPCPSVVSHVNLGPGSQTNTAEGIILADFSHQGTLTAASYIQALDLYGNILWSYCPGYQVYVTQPLGAGHFLILAQQGQNNQVQVLDASTNTIQASVSMASINAQLTALGMQTINDFNHDAIVLPSGWTAVIAHNEMMVAAGVQEPNAVDVLGNAIIVFDTTGTVKWVWNAFNPAQGPPITRPAVLGEKCRVSPGCPIVLATVANDWLHGNSLQYDSTDHNLIVSLRNQDWILKLDYQDGVGDGHIVWRLGQGGDFTMINTPQVASPWFSHQHTVSFQSSTPPRALSLFDNGNTRVAMDPTAYSRGQVLLVDESAFTVDIATNVNLGVFSMGNGSAQLLDNGDYWWMAGLTETKSARTYSRGFEFASTGYTGTANYSCSYGYTAYRMFRLTSLLGPARP